jgi:SAM-dependent methyltransferase
MTTLAALLCLLFVLGGLRLRGRARSLAPLPDSDEPVRPDHRFLFPDGVELDDATKRAASRYADAAGLEVLDLVPADYPGTDLLGLLELVDPNTYRSQLFLPARTAGAAILVTEACLNRAGPIASSYLGGKSWERSEFVRAANELKRCAPRDTSIALAPRLRHIPLPAAERFGVLRALLGDVAGLAILFQGFIFLFMALLLWREPNWGVATLLCFHGQALLGLSGLPWARAQMWKLVLFRYLLEISALFKTVTRSKHEPADQSEARDWYVDHDNSPPVALFEERREACPHCEGSSLETALTTGDSFQHKPGSFRLDRCADCGLVFQNPRLSIAGLGYHYRDFYDGAGAEKLDFVFSFNPGCYADRARTLEAHLDPHTPPTAWLDAGGGHGHFCLAASEVFPSTSFEVLDLSEAPLDAARRGWVSAAHRTTLTEFSLKTTASYDVVSLSHCLEHVPDPIAEVAAATRVLSPGGLLFIEVPDPTCKFGKWLGSNWLPWFQPQHLHLYPPTALAELCAQQGLEVLEIERELAHQPTDLHYAVLVLLSRISPPPDVPWLKPSTWDHHLAHAMLWLIGLPFLAVAVVLDKLVLARFSDREGWSNTYRLIARKKASA